ncbi:MAG: esterase-like activity of phytase family protein [Hyphomicrobiales bacterium]|nr:esterase-like activity of phytase family protein [Hyphomicrobiales bacterium]
MKKCFCAPLAVVILTVLASPTLARAPLKAVTPIIITAEPFSVSALTPRGGKIGKLTWQCGLILRSDAPQFGGFSGLAIDKTGTKLTALSDEGSWLAADLKLSDGCATGIANARMGPLSGAGGKSLGGKRFSDSEGFAAVRNSETDGAVYISFERKHRIAKYLLKSGEITGAPQAVSMPSAVSKLGNNEGLEALAVLQGGPLKGAIVAFAESAAKNAAEDAPAPGWLIFGGKTEALQMRLFEGFKITDMTPLDDGGLIVLERFYKGMLQGVHMRIRYIKAASIKPGAPLDGEVLLQLGGYANQVDNMEGAALHKTNNGETILTIISDNNFNPLQRTLLMQFLLPKLN